MDLQSVTCVSAQYFRKHAVPFSLLRLFVPALTVAEWSRSVLRFARAGQQQRRGGLLAPLFRFLYLDVRFVRNGESHQVPDRLQGMDSGGC